MQVDVLLQRKGSDVVCVAPDSTVAEVVAVLTGRRIGAVVVSVDGRAIEGIVSERDIVSRLALDGAAALAVPVGDLMASEVVTCGPSDTVEHLMTTMTDLRVRHIPVVADGVLAGLVSIGDVVKDRIEFLEHERKALTDYITNPY